MTQSQRAKKAEQLRLAAQIIETGCEWEVKHPALGWNSSEHIQSSGWGCPLDAVCNGVEIRIKPWNLPDPPAGRKWHCDGWTQGMLPDGWRPLLDGEVVQHCDEFQRGGSWFEAGEVTKGSIMIFPNDWRHRTCRPLPSPAIPVPEGWRELRDDEKDGKWIEGAKYLWEGIWWHHEKTGCYASSAQRIIVPVAKPRVPLEPCDVPPGSVIRSTGSVGFAIDGPGEWSAIINIDRLGVIMTGWDDDEPELLMETWESLMDGHEIKRPTDTEWQPCSKPAP